MNSNSSGLKSLMDSDESKHLFDKFKIGTAINTGLQ